MTAVCQQPLKNGGVFEVYHQSRWFMFRKLRVLMVLIYIFMVFRLLSNKTRYVFFYGLSVDDVSWFTFSNMVVFHGYHPLVIERGSGKFMIFLVVEPPSWKIMEFFSWDDDIPNWMESHKIHVPNHRPVCGYFRCHLWLPEGYSQRESTTIPNAEIPAIQRQQALSPQFLSQQPGNSDTLW